MIVRMGHYINSTTFKNEAKKWIDKFNNHETSLSKKIFFYYPSDLLYNYNNNGSGCKYYNKCHC